MMEEEIGNHTSETLPLLLKTRTNDIDTLHWNGANGEGANGNLHHDTDTGTDKPLATASSDGHKDKFANLPKRERYVLILCTIANLLTGCAFSLLGPFYPLEASRKGVSSTVIGLIFGCFDIVIFISAPIFGNHLTQLGPKFVYLSGIFVGGASTVIFGVLDKCPDGVPFIITSLLCRSVSALGASAFTTSSFAIVSSEFSDKIGTAFGILETGSGVGFMVGPALGGALYDLGGFGFPFYFIGGLILLNGVLIYRLLPKPQNFNSKRRQSFFSLLKNPLVQLPMCSVFSGVFGITCFDSTFARHFDNFDLSATIIGLFFIIAAAQYSVVAPVWGFVTDTKDIQGPIIVGGHLVFALGFLIIGPSSLLPFIPFELWPLGVGPVLIGLSFGCLLIPTMKCMIKGALEMNFENNMDTYALVSGLFNSVNCLGGFLGPVVGGALVERYGHSTTYTTVAVLHLVVGCLSCVFFVGRRFKVWRSDRHNSEFYYTVPEDPGVVGIISTSTSTSEVSPAPAGEDCKVDLRTESSLVSFHPPLSRSVSVTDSVF